MARSASRPEPKATESAQRRRRFTAEELAKWTKVVEVASLKPHPQNPNNGDQERLSESIARHGQFELKLISSDGYVLSGNHFYHDAMEKGRKTMAVTQLPLAHDDPQAIEIMLAANHITRKGKDDEGLLAALLGQIREVQGETVGTGFNDQEVEALLAKVEGLAVPESDYKNQYGVIVMCESENEQARIFEKLQAEGYTCRVVTT